MAVHQNSQLKQESINQKSCQDDHDNSGGAEEIHCSNRKMCTEDSYEAKQINVLEWPNQSSNLNSMKNPRHDLKIDFYRRSNWGWAILQTTEMRQTLCRSRKRHTPKDLLLYNKSWCWIQMHAKSHIVFFFSLYQYDLFFFGFIK